MKYCLITGGSRGLGSHLVKTFAKNGYAIVLNYVKNDDAACKVKDMVQKEYKVPVLLLKKDISKPKEIKEMKDILKEKNISIDVLVLNAGIDHVSDIEQKDEKTLQRVLDVNLIGNFLLTKIFGMEMEKKKKGCIIYINSDNVIDANDIVTLEYDISKAGLLMLAKDFASYFKYVKIHSIAPGWLDTQMNDFQNEKEFIPFVDIEKVCQMTYEQVKIEETGNVLVIKE